MPFCFHILLTPTTINEINNGKDDRNNKNEDKS